LIKIVPLLDVNARRSPADPKKTLEDCGIRFMAWISLTMEDTKKTDARVRIIQANTLSSLDKGIP
jgi:hypothetical protein